MCTEINSTKVRMSLHSVYMEDALKFHVQGLSDNIGHPFLAQNLHNRQVYMDSGCNADVFKTEITKSRAILRQLLKTCLQCKPTCWCRPMLCVSSQVQRFTYILVVSFVSQVLKRGFKKSAEKCSAFFSYFLFFSTLD